MVSLNVCGEKNAGPSFQSTMCCHFLLLSDLDFMFGPTGEVSGSGVCDATSVYTEETRSSWLQMWGAGVGCWRPVVPKAVCCLSQ